MEWILTLNLNMKRFAYLESDSLLVNVQQSRYCFVKSKTNLLSFMSR
jgi:hypothetical protein